MMNQAIIQESDLKKWKKKHKSSHFSPAFLFLSKERREALGILYGVCRILDDAVDGGGADPETCLSAWRQVFTDKSPNAVRPWEHEKPASDFLTVADRYNIPLWIMVDLIDKGVSIDLSRHRFQTAMDSESYCYGVAGTVGLACLPIFGVPLEEAKLYAVRLGIAIQWTNFIRDVGEDARMDRIYLPLDHFEQFGYTERDLLESKNSPHFQSLLEYEAEVALGHYKRAEDLLPLRWKKELLPARIMGSIYKTLLLKIKNKNFPVLNQNIRLNWMEKAWTAWQAKKDT